MAGVRGSGAALVQPRGIPPDLAYKAADDWHITINDDLAAQDHEGCTSLATATQWVKTLGCEIVYDVAKKPWRVTHPDWHTPSWLTLSELGEALAKIKQELSDSADICQYDAALAALRALEHGGQNEARLVFWFDN